MARGWFFSLDGLDGGGKSTQCRLLAKWLRRRGLAVVECADPGGTAVGEILRDVLLHRRGELTLACEALLFMASRAQLTAEVIRPALEGGKIVVCDRFVLANVVYQGHAGGLDPQQLWQVGRLATGGLEPDLMLVLDLPPELARGRKSGQRDRMESREAAFHVRVHEGFRKEAALHPEKIRLVDATQGVEAVHACICREVSQRLSGG